jgi:hypothetical protein
MPSCKRPKSAARNNPVPGDLVVTAKLLERLGEMLPANYAYLLVYLFTESQERRENPLVVNQAVLGVKVGLTKDSVRRALTLLSKSGFVGIKMVNRRIVIHINNIAEILKGVKPAQQERAIPAPKPHPEPLLEEGLKIEHSHFKTPPLPEPPPPLVHKKDISVEEAIRDHFQELWVRYPKPLGKKAAWRHFKASVLNPADWSAIQRALLNYLAYVQREGITSQYVQHGATWFNNWQDWATESFNPPSPQPPKPKEVLPTPEEMVSQADVHALVQKLAGGVKRIR